MPEPMELCLEDLSAAREDEKYVRCVAIAGGRPGLGLDARGQISWLSEGPLACELWISMDEQLILLRRDGAPEIEVHRSGRSLTVPAAKPVVLLDQDELRIDGKPLRLHLHGTAVEVHPPERLKSFKRAVGIAAAVLLTGAPALGAEPIPVRAMPPSPPPPPEMRQRATVGRVQKQQPAPDAGTVEPAPSKGQDAADAGTPAPENAKPKQK